MAKLIIDLADPDNPIAKVREISIEFNAVYKGEDAWNINTVTNKLENYLRANGFDIRSVIPKDYRDEKGNEITEDEMRQYLYHKHGHTQGKCSSCPDPLKWSEVERLRMKEYYKNKEVWDDKRRGRPPKGYNWATGEVEKKVKYVLETQEERAIRLKKERRTRGRPTKIEKPGTLFDDSAADFENRNPDVDPGLQIEYNKPTKRQGEK